MTTNCDRRCHKLPSPDQTKFQPEVGRCLAELSTSPMINQKLSKPSPPDTQHPQSNFRPRNGARGPNVVEFVRGFAIPELSGLCEYGTFSCQPKGRLPYVVSYWGMSSVRAGERGVRQTKRWGLKLEEVPELCDDRILAAEAEGEVRDVRREYCRIVRSRSRGTIGIRGANVVGKSTLQNLCPVKWCSRCVGPRTVDS